MIERVCLKCGRKFLARPFKVRAGLAKFCSHACNASYHWKGKQQPQSKLNILKAIASNKGRVPWNSNKQILICQQCSQSFMVSAYRLNTAKFCSYHCHHLHKKTIKGSNHPLWKRQLCKCEWCGKEVYVKLAKVPEFRFCSRRCLGSWVTSRSHHPTSIENIFAEALSGLHLSFEREYRIDKYSCDFVLLEYRLVIEADGDYWHSSFKVKNRDAIKDKTLRKLDWNIIRFTETDIKNNLPKCMLRLNKYINLINNG